MVTFTPIPKRGLIRVESLNYKGEKGQILPKWMDLEQAEDLQERLGKLIQLLKKSSQ